MTALYIPVLVASLLCVDLPRATHTQGGVAVTPEGQPVAGAELWVLTGELLQMPIAHGRTDPAGRFQITYKVAANVRLYVKVLVRDGQGRLGWSDTIHHGYYSMEEPEPLRLVVRPTVTATGRILGTDGKPLAGVKVTVEHFNQREAISGGPQPRHDQFIIPRHLAAQYNVTTDTDGRFTVPNVPVGSQLCVSLQPLGQPTITVFWQAKEPLRVQLPPLGRVEGRCVGVDSKLTVGVRLQCRSQLRSGQGPVELLGHAVETTVQPDGRFVFEKVWQFPSGSVELLQGREEPVLGELTAYTWQAGGTAQVEVKLQAAAQLTGRVVDQTTGRGVSNVRLTLARVDQPSGQPARLIVLRSVTTADDGSFQVYLPPAEQAQVRLERLPQEYLSPVATLDDVTLGPPVKLAAGQTVELPPYQLPRATVVQGQAVDGKGQPVAGAEVHLIIPNRPGSFRGIGPATHTDAAGRFSLKGIDPTDHLPIRIRSRDGTTAGKVVVMPSERKEPLQVEVKPEHALRLKGQVVDQRGQPIAGAKVMVRWGSRYVSRKTTLSGVQKMLERQVTDAQGRYATGPLWPGDDYALEVSAPNCTPGSSPKVELSEGQTVEMSPIILHRVGGVVAGRVVDRQGKPIAAEVFNRADGPKILATQTDAAGNFRLEGLFDGPVWVFVKAREKGYVPAVAPATTGGPAVTVTLRREEEPLPPPDKVAAERLEAQRKQAAKALIDQAVRAAGEKPLPTRLNVAWARLEPEQVLEHLNGAKGPAADRVRMAIVAQVLCKDVDDALTLANECDPEQAFHYLLTAAQPLATTDPDTARRVAGELLAWARRLNMPGRAGGLARVGTLVGKLGQATAHRRLVEEAAALVETVGGAHGQGYARGLVATELAAFDLDRAERIIQAIAEPHERARHRINIVIALAAKDLPKALAIYDAVARENPRGGFAYAKVRMAYWLALAGDLGRATQVIEGIEPRPYRLEALGWAAVATKDRATSHRLIEQMVALASDPKEARHYTWRSFGGHVGPVARLAWFAAQVDYPHPDRLLFLMLDQRPTAEELRSEHYRTENRATGTVWMATVLALVDPAAARHLLLSVEPHREVVLHNTSEGGCGDWLQAWALVDPLRAVQLVEELEKRKSTLPSHIHPRSEVVDLLTLPPGERPRNLLRRGFFWHPGEE